MDRTAAGLRILRVRWSGLLPLSLLPAVLLVYPVPNEPRELVDTVSYEPATTPTLVLSNSGAEPGPVALVPDQEDGFLVYWNERSITPTEVDHNIWYTRVSRDGARAATAVNVTRYPPHPLGTRASAASPELGQVTACSDGTGQIYLAWTQSWDAPPSYFAEVFFSASDDWGATFSTPVGLTGSEFFGSGPTLACHPDGAILLAFREFPVPEIGYRMSADHGRTFSASHLLPRGEWNGAAYSSVFTFAPNGELFAISVAGQVGYSTTDVWAARSDDLGTTWSEPLNLSLDPAYSVYQAVAASSNGTIVAAWSDTRSGAWSVYARTYEPSTERWSKDLWRLNTSTNGDPSGWIPSIAVSPENVLWCTWNVAWLQPRYSVRTLKTDGRLGRRHRGAVSEAVGGSWNEQIAASPGGAVAITWIGTQAPDEQVRLRYRLIRKPFEAVPHTSAR